MKICEACGKKVAGGTFIGGTILCRTCAVDVQQEIDKLRAAGKPVNAGHIARRLFKAEHSAGNYLLRDIPDELWQKVKHRAVDDGDSLRDLVIKALYLYINEEKAS